MPRGIYNRKNRRTREADLGLGKSVEEVTRLAAGHVAGDDPNAAAPPEIASDTGYRKPEYKEPEYLHTMGPAAATRAANPEATAARVATEESAPTKPPRRTRRRRARRGKRQAAPRDMSSGIAEGLAQVLKNFEAQNLQHLQQQIKHLEGRLSAVEQAGTSFRDTMIAGLNRH